MPDLRLLLADCPLVAILRNIRPEMAAETGACLVAAGVRLIEVPLNSPGADQSLSVLRARVGGEAVIGAGTVRTGGDLDRLQAVGGQFAVSPHFNRDLVRETLERGLLSIPGVMTPSEAYAALAEGATALKLFPAEVMGPALVKAWRPVMAEALLIPTGGIGAGNARDWLAAGADGLGIGSAIFDVGGDLAETKRRATAMVTAVNGVREG